jgi:hypothetical protein
LRGSREFGGDYDDWVYEYLGTKEWESDFGESISITWQNALPSSIDIRANSTNGINHRSSHATLWAIIPVNFASH